MTVYAGARTTQLSPSRAFQIRVKPEPMNLEMPKLEVSNRTAPWLAWTAWVLALALTAFSLFLLVLNRSYHGVPIYLVWFEETLVGIGYSSVGVIVASRRPKNIIGWLFCTIGLLFAMDHFCSEYSIYTLLASPGSLPTAIRAPPTAGRPWCASRYRGAESGRPGCRGRRVDATRSRRRCRCWRSCRGTSSSGIESSKT